MLKNCIFITTNQLNKYGFSHQKHHKMTHFDLFKLKAAGALTYTEDYLKVDGYNVQIYHNIKLTSNIKGLRESAFLSTDKERLNEALTLFGNQENTKVYLLYLQTLTNPEQARALARQVAKESGYEQNNDFTYDCFNGAGLVSETQTAWVVLTIPTTETADA
jgi:hypothetical protein